MLVTGLRYCAQSTIGIDVPALEPFFQKSQNRDPCFWGALLSVCALILYGVLVLCALKNEKPYTYSVLAAGLWIANNSRDELPQGEGERATIHAAQAVLGHHRILCRQSL